MLETRLKMLETIIEMKRHPEDHACQSAAMLHELLNDVENLRMDRDMLFGRVIQIFNSVEALLMDLQRLTVKDLKIKMLEARLKMLETRLEMERHPEDHACQSAAMLHELLNDMENLRME
ncbi:hypothetical protein Tco_1074195 [Tanacetum coccineum]